MFVDSAIFGFVSRSHKIRPVLLTLVGLTVLATFASCSSDSKSSSAPVADRAATTSTVGSTVPVERFEGSVDDFYEVPDPLPHAARGTLIRTQAIEAPAGQVGLRVMYHSEDVRGRVIDWLRR